MKSPTTRMRTGVTAVALIFACAPLVYAFADARDNARAALRPVTMVQSQSPAPTPVPTPTSPPPSGGITSTTDGSVNSGGNTGGNVTTGDQHVDVHEVNVGPTNNPPPPAPPSVGPSPVPAPQCDLRTRTGCPTQDGGRTR